MIIFKSSISYDFLKVLMILISIRPFHFHNLNSIVNFNDAIARIDRIEEKNGKATVYYGEVGSLPAPVGKQEALTSKAIILRPPNGWAVIYGSKKYVIVRPGYKSEPQFTEYFFGPMSNRGFWLFTEVDGSKDQTFVLLNNLMIKKQERININQDIAKGYAWKSVQMFEWNNELFVCFSTSGKTLVVIRLKTLPDQIDAHGTYISSFYVESTTNPEAFFLPTYPYPIFYYSRSEKDKVRVFHSIELKDIIKESDKGFDECKKKGRYPSNFLRLRPYIKNLTRVAANTPNNCESFDIPLFFWNQSTPCFELGPDVFPTSLDMYTVALGFNAKVLSYIERDEDVRCDLSKCGESMANCVGQKINSKELIVSTYWGLDDFALIRWTVSGSRLKFRLLNCDYFNTCPLCTLYGGLSCVWSSSKCQVKDKSLEISQEPCFAEVAVIKEQLPPNKMILTVRLPYKLNPKVGENVSIKLDGQEFTNVKFVSDVYKVETADLSFGVGMIVIKRGSYFMNSTIRFQKQESSIILEIILYLILIVVILTVGLGLIAFLILRDKKNAINIDPDPSPGPMPANT